MRKMRDWRSSMEDELCYPDADVIDRDEHLVIRIDLPGVAKDDIKLNINADSVEVKAEKTEEEEEKEEDYYLSERYYRGFYRKLSLPKTIVPDEARARFKNGVLEIVAPKAEEESSSVEIEEE